MIDFSLRSNLNSWKLQNDSSKSKQNRENIPDPNISFGSKNIEKWIFCKNHHCSYLGNNSFVRDNDIEASARKKHQSNRNKLFKIISE